MSDIALKTWRELISSEMKKHADSFDNLVSCTLSDDDLDEEFDSGYGKTRGKPFTLWTKDRVYFPLSYDGLEFVGSVSRFPDGKPTEHIQ